MSVPKKHKTSSARNRGRSHQALKKIQLIKCPKCKIMILPHRVCKNCGYYNGEEIIKVKTALDKKKARKEKKEKKEREKKESFESARSASSSRSRGRDKKKEAKQKEAKQ